MSQISFQRPDEVASIRLRELYSRHGYLPYRMSKFESYDKASRRGRNPQTDEAITLPPRRVVVFRLSRKFRAEINS